MRKRAKNFHSVNTVQSDSYNRLAWRADCFMVRFDGQGVCRTTNNRQSGSSGMCQSHLKPMVRPTARPMWSDNCVNVFKTSSLLMRNWLGTTHHPPVIFNICKLNPLQIMVLFIQSLIEGFRLISTISTDVLCFQTRNLFLIRIKYWQYSNELNRMFNLKVSQTIHWQNYTKL